MTAFTLTSPDIADGRTIAQSFEFDGFGCSGRNQSPVLRWSGAPEGTKGFAVNVYDPDAPTGSGFWHWYVIDLPASVSELPANAGAKGGAHLPAGARQIRNDYGQYAWGGMCPPPGDKPHRYIFTVHALSVERIDVPDDAPAALAGFMVNAHTLAKASFTATYGR
ncbi:phosphatidylethanolamine-binding protein [Diaphorobacter nitroreducens]|uniref:YbhB/YbcL family Raf kinase inhibitor-like protein n=1 Tax=Diaphorobacter nitroreducens TaxID=164759 RepID=UPI000B59AC99|nr:YbhB/YbcL family Raf kinase inhibitor-like protein [Diaphorobacter nitroreducens]ASI69080.1 phosphatidylethanolamine-binding protein [Diaphorobacter nitroreducens]